MTEKQRAANKRNAQRSTGPVTPKGKARSSSNALSHGLTANQVVIPGESEEAFGALRDDLFAEYNPVGPLERNLIDNIAAIMWRMRRIPHIEASIHRSCRSEQGDKIYNNPETLTHFRDSTSKYFLSVIDRIRREHTEDVKLLPRIGNDINTKEMVIEYLEHMGIDKDLSDKDTLNKDQNMDLTQNDTLDAAVVNSEYSNKLSNIARYESILLNNMRHYLNNFFNLQKLRAQ